MMELFALINREKLFVLHKMSNLVRDVETLSYHNVAHACEVVHATFAILTDVITEGKVGPISVILTYCGNWSRYLSPAVR